MNVQKGHKSISKWSLSMLENIIFAYKYRELMTKQYAISASNLAKFLGIGFANKDRTIYVKECMANSGMSPIDSYMNYLNTRDIPTIQNDTARKAKNEEDDDINIFESLNSVKVSSRNEKIYVKKLDLNTEHEYYLFGSVDGIIDDEILFELKRCSSKYKGSMGAWNKPQLECLMYLTGLTQSILHKIDREKDLDDEPNSIKYNHDENYWTTLMNKFTSNLEKFKFEKFNVKIPKPKFFELPDGVKRLKFRRPEIL